MNIIQAAPLWLLALFCVSCRTATPLPPADLSAPGWHIQQGQAIWKPPGHRPEMTGDLLLATNANGNFFLQFTKDPFPLASAEVLDGRWQISFGVDEQAWRGQGEPPARFAWFQLPSALLDGKSFWHLAFHLDGHQPVAARKSAHG